MNQPSQPSYDLVIFGATSFVGKLIVDYVRQSAPEGMRIAVAGRNRKKLAALDAPYPMIVADAADADAMARLARSAKVVLTTVGPYNLYGRPLIRACAENGTDYVDLSGEVVFVHDSVVDLHEIARDSGAKIIHSAGFDSVPSDIAVFQLSRMVDELGEVEMVISDLNGSLSGGTVASMMDSFQAASSEVSSPERRQAIRSPFALVPEQSSEKRIAATGFRAWDAPFFMAGYNTRLVRRSAQLLGYGENFNYVEYHRIGGRFRTAGYALLLLLVSRLIRQKWGRAIMRRFLPKPGQGPSAAKREKGGFTVTTTDLGSGAAVRVRLDMDPGYEGTALMAGEAVFSLLDGAGTPGAGTPATLGETYVERLRNAGMEISGP